MIRKKNAMVLKNNEQKNMKNRFYSFNL